jgi:hypothetical protein
MAAYRYRRRMVSGQSQPQERHTELFEEYEWPDCLGWLVAEQCLLTAGASQVDAADEYRGYEGQQYRADLRYRGFWRSLQVTLVYRGEYSSREDFAFEDQFFSVSPQRHGLALSGVQPLTDSLVRRRSRRLSV